MLRAELGSYWWAWGKLCTCLGFCKAETAVVGPWLMAATTSGHCTSASTTVEDCKKY